LYSRCIYCSADLGDNESLQAFPVGAQVAFDAGRGRLWAICGRCSRWNLAPIEERWEAVEEAERAFRDARLKAQRENVGLTQLADGTRLIRVGEALARELASWRYGGALVARWRRARERWSPLREGFAPSGRGLTGAVASLAAARRDRRVVCHLPAERSPTGDDLTLLRGHLRGAVLDLHDGDPVLHLSAAASPLLPARIPGLWAAGLHEEMTLTGPAVRDTLARTLIDVNASGASSAAVLDALTAVEEVGGSRWFLQAAAAKRITLQLPHRTPISGGAWDGYWNRRAEREGVPGEGRGNWRAEIAERICGPGFDRLTALALEMALHEEVERRALEGELAILQSAWREAEEIAALADRL
jgi:hypothetical protein